MLDRIRQGWRQVIGQGAGSRAASAPTTLESSEGRLLIRQRVADGLVDLLAFGASEPMLTMRGQLAGPLSTGRLTGRAATSLVRLEIGLRVDAQVVPIEITVMRPPMNESTASARFTLARARRRRIAPDDQAIELLYVNGEDLQIRYLVQMPASVKPVEFREFSRHESVFKEVPSVSQMVAFLRATLHHRRTTLRSLSSMARNAAIESVQDMISQMNERLSQGQDFTTDELRQLLNWLTERGRTPNPNTAAALALLSDIYLGHLGRPQLEALVERGETMPLSGAALAAASAFLGQSIDLDGAAPAFAAGASAPDVDRTLAFLRSTVAQRNALSILSDLADDSGSERSRGRVAQLLEHVGPLQNLLNDEHVALQSYLEKRGRRIQSETISALAIYVDFEAGILNETDINGLTPKRAFVDASLYSMLAIARAFDYPLHCWLLPMMRSNSPADQDSMWRQLADLVGLCDGGVIARFIEAGEAGHQTMHVPTSADLHGFRARGYEFTGEFLADIPTIAHLEEHDLAAFEDMKIPFIARFVSEGGAIQWRRFDVVHQAASGALRELLKRPHSFIDRYDIFHFGHAVFAHKETVDAAGLCGSDNVLTVYRDARGADHYRHFRHVERAEDVTAPPQRDWEWDGTVVRFPQENLFPRTLVEASHEYLLGLPDERASLERLDAVYSGLENCLRTPAACVALSTVEDAAAQVRQALQSASLRALLVGIIEPAERDAVVADVGDGDNLFVSSTLLERLDHPDIAELTALAVLSNLCGAHDRADHERELHDLEDLLLDRMLAAVESESVEVKRRAIELMGSEIVARHAEQRLAFSYVLCRLMDSELNTMADAAARALGALALRAVFPPPPLAVQRPPAATPRLGALTAETTHALAEEILSVYGLPHEHHKPVMTMLASLLS